MPDTFSPILRADDLEVRDAYNDAESLAEFGEWCAMRLFGGAPERLPDRPLKPRADVA